MINSVTILRVTNGFIVTAASPDGQAHAVAATYEEAVAEAAKFFEID